MLILELINGIPQINPDHPFHNNLQEATLVPTQAKCPESVRLRLTHTCRGSAWESNQQTLNTFPADSTTQESEPMQEKWKICLLESFSPKPVSSVNPSAKG